MSEPALDLKYTDRDVRDHPKLGEIALQYAEHYTGSFEFMVDMKNRIECGHPISTGHIRGILNCMRVDPRARLPYAPSGCEHEAEIINLPKVGKIRRLKECDNTNFHPAHDPGHDYFYCVGRYRINRELTTTTVVRVKAQYPFMAAKSPTSLIHRITNLVPARAVWSNEQHDYGWSSYTDWYGPDYMVQPLCMRPYWIKNPILLTGFMVEQMQSDEETRRPRCERCS